MLIVGGGVIGLEFATVYTRFGAKVLVVEALANILTGTDLEISKTLGRILKKQGVEIALSTKVETIEKVGDQKVKATFNGEYTSNKPETREFDMVLVAVGRRPVTDSLNLAAAGLKTNDKGFLDVDAQRKTSVDGIYAIGDVTGGPLLAHKAMKEGVVAAEVIAGDKASAFDPVAIPELRLHRSRSRHRRALRRGGQSGRLHDQDRQVPADRVGPRAHDERNRRLDQADRRREDRPAAGHAHRRAASRIADRRRASSRSRWARRSKTSASRSIRIRP